MESNHQQIQPIYTNNQYFNSNWFGNNFRVGVDDQDYIFSIKFGNNFDISYIDFVELNEFENSINFFNTYGVKIEDVFKFDFYVITRRIAELYPQVKFKIAYDVPSYNEIVIEKNIKSFPRHVYLRIETKEDSYDCGFDLIEPQFDSDGKKINHHDEKFNFKYPSSLINMDYYNYFDIETDSLKEFFSECIYDIMVMACSIQNDEYKLAEIIFIKSNIDDKNLENKLQLFKKIINMMKIGYVDFYEVVYHCINPVNPETGKKLTEKKLIEFIETTIFNGDKLTFYDNKNITIDDFKLILMSLPLDMSAFIIDYRNTYLKCADMVIKACVEIIKLTKRINKKKRYIPQYVKTCIFEQNLNDVQSDDKVIQEK